MKILQEFREFALKGNVVDLAVGVIIGSAFGGVTKSIVDDLLMPPIGKLIGNLDFSNLYISLSDTVDAANAAKAQLVAATQPATQSLLAHLPGVLDTGARLTLAEAKAKGPVIAYGNSITTIINFVIVAFSVFMVIKVMNMTRRRAEKEPPAVEPAPPEDVRLLTEIRDLLKGPAR